MVKYMFKKVSSVLLLGLLVSACGTNSDPKFTSVTVVENGFEEGSEWCSDFDLTEKEASRFLEKSKELTATQYHNEYEHLSCYVKGTARYKEAFCQFTIWAGSTAELICDNDQEYLLGCNECEFGADD